MRNVFLSVIVVLLAGCASDKPRAIGGTLEFRLAPSFAESTVIEMRRGHGGVARGAVLVYPANSRAGQGAKIVKRFEVPAEHFDRLSDDLENEKLRVAAQNAPIPGFDGTAWIFRKRKGSRSLQYAFHLSGLEPNMEIYMMARELAERFAAMAELPDLLSEDRRN